MRITCVEHPARAVAVALGLLIAAAGCNHSTEHYLPATATARQALETALQAWQNGQPTGQIAGTAPVVSVIDSKRKPGQKLGSYEILKEEEVDGRTYFSVKLKLKDGSPERVTRYVVVGRDPLWVYQEDDFKSVSGM
jgi:hypothetical protein